MAVLIRGGQIAQDEIGPFGTAHAVRGGRLDEFLAIDVDRTVFDAGMFAAHFIELVGVVVAPFHVGRVVRRREDFPDEVARIVALLFDDPLPDSGRRARVVAGPGDITEGQVVCFPFGSPVDMDRLNLIADRVEDEAIQAGTANRVSQHHLANFDVDLLLRRIGDVMLLAMAHFVTQDDGDFIIVADQVEHALIDDHDMAHRAGRVERRIRADIPAVGQSLDTGVRLGDTGAEAVHDGRQPFIIVRIIEDTGLLGDGLVNLVLPFLGRIVVLDLLAQG